MAKMRPVRLWRTTCTCAPPPRKRPGHTMLRIIRQRGGAPCFREKRRASTKAAAGRRRYLAKGAASNNLERVKGIAAQTRPLCLVDEGFVC
jgi:hypothetical protein